MVRLLTLLMVVVVVGAVCRVGVVVWAVARKQTAYQVLLGSGPVGDDDLWYHHIPGTLRFILFSPSPPWGLPPGSGAL